MSLLAGLRVVQIGDGLAAAVCGRLFADIGADVDCVDPDKSSPLATYLNHGKNIVGDQAAARPSPTCTTRRPASSAIATRAPGISGGKCRLRELEPLAGQQFPIPVLLLPDLQCTNPDIGGLAVGLHFGFVQMTRDGSVADHRNAEFGKGK